MVPVESKVFVNIYVFKSHFKLTIAVAVNHHNLVCNLLRQNAYQRTVGVFLVGSKARNSSILNNENAVDPLLLQNEMLDFIDVLVILLDSSGVPQSRSIDDCNIRFANLAHILIAITCF